MKSRSANSDRCMPSMNARSTGLPFSGRRRARAHEELVAGLLQQRDVVAELDLQVELGVDAQRGALGEREAVAVAQADLEVAGGGQRPVQAAEEVEVVHP